MSGLSSGSVESCCKAGAVYKSYVWPAILYGSEAWCLKGEMGIL